MSPDFKFFGFNPDEDLRNKAYRALQRLLDMAPYGSMAVALLEKEDQSYRCAIEIYSKHGPFIARFVHDAPDTALERSVRTLSRKLEHWHDKVHSPRMQPRFSC